MMMMMRYGNTRARKNSLGPSGRLLPSLTPAAYTSGTVATESEVESSMLRGGMGTTTLNSRTKAATQESPNPTYPMLPCPIWAVMP